MPSLDDQGLRLSDLRIFDVVLRESGLTRAGEKLGLSQPAISKALARLRIHFQDALLVRSGARMQATPRASEIAVALRALLLAADTMNRPAAAQFDPANSIRTFKVLVSDVGMIQFLPPLTSRLAAAGPLLRLEAVPLASRHFEAKLASAEADLALGAYRKAPPGLRRQRLYTDSYLSVARAPYATRARLRTRAGYADAQHIIVTASDTGHSAHQMAQEAIESTIAPDKVLLRLPSFVAAALVALHVDGVATLPARLATSLAATLNLVTIPPPIPMPLIEICQYWHERFQRDPGHRWLRRTCFDALSGQQ